VLGKGVARTHALEALIICSFLRGLSVRDVESALEETFGEQVIGKSTVARVCKDTAVRYAAWCERDLCAHDLVYLYLDAIYLKLRPPGVEVRHGHLGRSRGIGPAAGGLRIVDAQAREVVALDRI